MTLKRFWIDLFEPKYAAKGKNFLRRVLPFVLGRNRILQTCRYEWRSMSDWRVIGRIFRGCADHPAGRDGPLPCAHGGRSAGFRCTRFCWGLARHSIVELACKNYQRPGSCACSWDTLSGFPSSAAAHSNHLQKHSPHNRPTQKITKFKFRDASKMKRNTLKKLTSLTLVLLLVMGDGIATGINTAPEA